jgi:hypothetical protein
MEKYPNHEYKVLQSLDCGSDKFIMSKQIFANLMIRPRPKEIFSVDNTKSSNFKMSLELSSATSKECLGH